MNDSKSRDAAPSRSVLVTGGAGFIGSHLVEGLLARGDRVSVIDDLSTGRAENLPEHSNLKFIHADLAAALTEMERAPARPRFDEIYHLAAAVGVQRVVEKPVECIETNVFQTAALLRFALAQATRGAAPRVLITSSSEVYGKSTKSPFREDDDCVIGPTSALRWSYACSKIIDEHLALAYHARSAFAVVVVRLFNTVGPRQVGEYGMVLPRFVADVIAGRSPRVFGDGRQSRCFCDVRDVAGALPRLVGDPACAGGVFNLGSDEPTTIYDLAQTVIRVLKADLRPVLVPYEEAYGPGFEDLRQRRPDLTRVRQAIGYAPAIPLEQTILDIADSLERTRAGRSRRSSSAISA